MVHVVKSDKPFQDVVNALPDVVVKNKFGVLGTHDLRKKMNEKGVAFERDCVVFEVCNPQKAKAVLEENMEISTALPCRISVYREGGKTKLATIKPTALLGMFPNPELGPVAEEVERTLFRIMMEAS
ncbi:MAG: DUF302 domain-containing protein [Elusimicrobiota bacterium]